MFEAAFLLLVSHAVCDYVLQTDAMRLGKSRRRDMQKEYGAEFPPWIVWITSHALTHGGGVYLVTGSWIAGALETVLHAVIDHQKCEERISFNVDQALHLLCKAAWLVFFV